MNTRFAHFIRTAIGEAPHYEFAARLGISPSQLSKVLRGLPCERATQARIVAGISDSGKVRGQCLAALLADVRTAAGGEDAQRVCISVR